VKQLGGAIARAAAFRMLVMSRALVMRRLSLSSEPANKSGHDIPKNRCRTTIAERMVETLAELRFTGDQVVCLSHDQATRSGPASDADSTRCKKSRKARLDPMVAIGVTLKIVS
jgi:hypothetical protein